MSFAVLVALALAVVAATLLSGLARVAAALVVAALGLSLLIPPGYWPTIRVPWPEASVAQPQVTRQPVAPPTMPPRPAPAPVQPPAASPAPAPSPEPPQPEGVPIPHYDVEAACRRQNLLLSTCVEYVQPYYDRLTQIWPMVDEPLKQRCLAQFTQSIHARYVQIYACIETEMIKREMEEKQRNPTRFRY